MVQAPVRQTTLDVRGVKLVTREAGVGQPLLYLHDELSTGWNPFLDGLTGHFHVVAPELPGFGDSERPDWVESVEDVAFLVSDIVDAVGSGVPVPAVASSLGAWMVLEAAVRGAAVSSIVLIGSPGAYIAGDPPFDYFSLTPEERRALFFDDPSVAPPVGDDHIVRNEAMTARLVWQPRYVSPKLGHRIHRIASPTLIAWGKNDRFLSLAHGDWLVSGLPKGKLSVVDGAGHFPALDKPNETAKLVIDFLS